MVDILAITAHPDDAEIGVGGILLKAKRQGLKTGLIVCTGGENSGYASITERRREAEAGAALLELDYVQFLDFPDAGVEVNTDNMETLIPLIRACAPDVVLTIHPQDYHPDHQAVSQLVDKTVFAAGLKKHAVDDTTWQPHQFFYFSLDPRTNPRRPDIIVDVSEVWADKKKALDAHASQEVTESAEEWARYLGMLGKCTYGEGLYLKHALKISTIAGL